MRLNDEFVIDETTRVDQVVLDSNKKMLADLAKIHELVAKTNNFTLCRTHPCLLYNM